MPKAKNERFENVYSQGSLSTMEIWVDKETGVNYLFRTDWSCRRHDASA